MSNPDQPGNHCGLVERSTWTMAAAPNLRLRTSGPTNSVLVVHDRSAGGRSVGLTPVTSKRTRNMLKIQTASGELVDVVADEGALPIRKLLHVSVSATTATVTHTHTHTHRHFLTRKETRREALSQAPVAKPAQSGTAGNCSSLLPSKVQKSSALPPARQWELKSSRPWARAGRDSLQPWHGVLESSAQDRAPQPQRMHTACLGACAAQ